MAYACVEYAPLSLNFKGSRRRKTLIAESLTADPKPFVKGFVCYNVGVVIERIWQAGARMAVYMGVHGACTNRLG